MTTLTVTITEDSVVLKGEPSVLRNVMFLIGNVVWPGWYEHENGRNIYLGYADGGKDGEINAARKHFFDPAWENVKKHLEVDGVQVIEV